MNHAPSLLLGVLACIPSGAALVAKAYGFGEMNTWTWVAVLPSFLVLLLLWWRVRGQPESPIRSGLILGLWGGLAGTVAYDLIRIPFRLAGQRVFAPIEAYGVWIADAEFSSGATEALGWAYHLSNGITFAIAYALVMRGRHWAWALLWALALETVAVVTPLGEIFALRGDAKKLFVVYLGHVAYGVPLGVIVQRAGGAEKWLGRIRGWKALVLALLGVAALATPALLPQSRDRDARSEAGVFRVVAGALEPDWQRLAQRGTLRVVNPSQDAVTLVLGDRSEAVVVPPADSRVIRFDRVGIFPLRVETEGMTRSSFVIVEPVSAIGERGT